MKKHEGKTFCEKLKYYVDGEADTFFEYFMLLVVFVNTATLGFETSPSIEAKYSDLLFWTDQICLYIFVFELFIKVIAYNREFFGEMRTDEEGEKFFHINKWNIFDETAIRELREETGINLSNSVNEKNAIICSFHYPCFEWKTFMFEVASDFHVPERFCYEFSEMRFISLKEIHQYELAFGVKKEIKHFKQKFFNILEENHRKLADF